MTIIMRNNNELFKERNIFLCGWMASLLLANIAERQQFIELFIRLVVFPLKMKHQIY